MGTLPPFVAKTITNATQWICRYWDTALLWILITLVVGSAGYLMVPHPKAVLSFKALPPIHPFAVSSHMEATTTPALEEALPLDAAETQTNDTIRHLKRKKQSYPYKPPKNRHIIVNINTANEAQLQQLPGIGPKMATRISAYRKAHGPFLTIDDLDSVSGIGPKSLEKLRPQLKL